MLAPLLLLTVTGARDTCADLRRNPEADILAFKFACCRQSPPGNKRLAVIEGATHVSFGDRGGGAGSLTAEFGAVFFRVMLKGQDAESLRTFSRDGLTLTSR